MHNFKPKLVFSRLCHVTLSICSNLKQIWTMNVLQYSIPSVARTPLCTLAVKYLSFSLTSILWRRRQVLSVNILGSEGRRRNRRTRLRNTQLQGKTNALKIAFSTSNIWNIFRAKLSLTVKVNCSDLVCGLRIRPPLCKRGRRKARYSWLRPLPPSCGIARPRRVTRINSCAPTLATKWGNYTERGNDASFWINLSEFMMQWYLQFDKKNYFLGQKFSLVLWGVTIRDPLTTRGKAENKYHRQQNKCHVDEY